MRRIHYANDVIVTADRVADAVLAHAQLLAIHHTSDTISIPVLSDDGRIGSSKLLLGPASQIISDELKSTESDIADLDDRFPDPPYFPSPAMHSHVATADQGVEYDSDLVELLRALEGA
ncbi:hypothetical protein [Planctomonas psychrotolerans]|uniref:hypothetical protein n=1 Tax=Planctomonas psychrotolerans TaxID=2528712 RepID=UPI00123B7D23|nr:hypothetical protein [Planctomonas psychrotolerans]